MWSTNLGDRGDHLPKYKMNVVNILKVQKKINKARGNVQAVNM